MRKIRHNTGEFCLVLGRNNVAKITFHISHVITRPAFCATQIMSVTFAHTYIYQCIDEHKSSVIGEHVAEQHGGGQNECRERIRGIEKLSRKVGVFNMRNAVNQRSQTLFKQSDWIQSKLFN